MAKQNYKPLIKNSKRRKELLSNKETSIIKKENRKLIKSIAIIGIILICLVVVSCVIDIFDFAYKIHPYAGYGVLALIVLALLIFVIRPIVIALSSPCFTLDIVDVKSKREVSRKNYHSLKKVANNLLEKDNITEESKNVIKASMHSKAELNDVLRTVYDKEVSKNINKIINESAVRVLLSTAISQNNKFDGATVALVNIRMIMRIVVACGYHPSYPQLYKLIAKVFRNALIAYTLQTAEVDNLIFNGINKLVNGALTNIPFVGELTKSITQGAANALLTLRVGIITRKYLYEEFDIQAMMEDPDETNETILEEAVNEANSSIDDIIEQCKKNKKEKQTV